MLPISAVFQVADMLGDALAPVREPLSAEQLIALARRRTGLTEFGETVGDEEAQTPFELLRNKNLHHELGGLIEVLDDREKKIIFERFGLNGGKPKTLEDVSKDFGVTRERIRQLQYIALAKLRRALSKRDAPVQARLLVES